ncbi:hypothetical protein [Amycolatopsis kentuckyensis]|nr:hypothetical protein [Amycolatopsis kentuckyensis]
MAVPIDALQELPAQELVTPEGCCGFASYITCPWNTFDYAEVTPG